MRNEKVLMMRVNLLNKRVSELELALAASKDQKRLLKLELDAALKAVSSRKKSKEKPGKE